LGCGLAHVATRRVNAAVDAWTIAHRMRKVRRDPSALTRALRSAGKILVVCHGNIIRSPFAAQLVAEALRDRPGIAVRSGGLAAIAGKPSHPRAVVAASKQRIDLTDHHAAPLDEQVVSTSDVIFVMEVPHLVAMRRRFPNAEGKTFLLTCLASDTPLEIQDPYDGDAARFDTCFNYIVRAVEPIVRTLSNTAA
jgi:protein-tyrosine phosphatase